MKYSGIELIKALSLAFGPSGCEDDVRELLIEQIEGSCDGYFVDRSGNLIARLKGQGMDYHPEAPRRILLSAHMDEVGLMITEITEEGYLRFGTVGGIDPRVLCGRHVTIRHAKQTVHGVIASKAIHLQTAEERTKTTPVRKMYIDIGAKDAEDAKKYVTVGDCAVFDSEFVTFGKDGRQMKGKAIDDRAGCAALVEILRTLYVSEAERPFDLYLAFTTCEEVGIAGSSVAAFAVEPEIAIVLEATAVNDLPNAADNAKVSFLGEGGTLSLVDGGAIYDRALINYARSTAEANGIKCQIKRAAAGMNDAAHIQRTRAGARVMALSLPTRYIHSASNVALYEDYESVRDLIVAMLREWKLD